MNDNDWMMNLLFRLNPEIADYIEEMTSLVSNQNELNQLLEKIDKSIKDQSHNNPPKQLFRYRTVDRAIRELSEKKVYLSPITEFSDPYDTIISLSSMIDAENITLDKSQEEQIKLIMDTVSPK